MTKDIKKYAFKVGASLQIEVVDMATLVANNKEHVIAPHRTDFYHIFLFENCSPTHIVDFNPVKVNPFSLLFIDKDRIHQFDKSLKYKGRILIFTDNFFCTTETDSAYLRSSRLFNDMSDSPQLQVSKEVFKKLPSILNAVSEEYSQQPDTIKHNILKNHLHNILLLAEREKRKQYSSEIKKGPDLEYVLQFKDLLEKHFITLKQVPLYAEKIHISEKRLRQATNAMLGKTPKELIDERMLLEAKRFLVHGNKSIKEIGFYLGFEEPTNFIKYFRKHTNKTPIEFREEYLAR